ncbi:MAG: ECF transporter S component [Armatimonadota bacterium]
MKLTARELAMGGLFGALALALPALFHLVALAGPVFLPMYLPVAALAFLGTTRVAAIVGALVPLVSAGLTGMPPLSPPIALFMSGELLALSVTSGLSYHRLKLPVVVCLLVGSAASRCVLALEVAAIGPLFGFRPALWKYVVGGIVTGWPGLVLQLLVIPAFVRAVGRRPQEKEKHADSTGA